MNFICAKPWSKLCSLRPHIKRHAPLLSSLFTLLTHTLYDCTVPYAHGCLVLRCLTPPGPILSSIPLNALTPTRISRRSWTQHISLYNPKTPNASKRPFHTSVKL